MNFNDKRSFYRMMLNSDVTLTIIDVETNNQLIATCRDLSATGMSIEVSYPIALRTKVRVKIFSSNNNVPSLDVFGNVVRVEEQSSRCYLIGIAIEEFD
jgi:hypothetical protein|tara:strand:- start:674 stop:970 length:297 start_codon:yes stop_codon:yes gene_type:complete